MDRESFLADLRSALSGKVPATVIEDYAAYYNEYIISEVRQGKTEEEVLAELGNARLLAKTIIEANKHAEDGHSYEENDAEYEYTQDDVSYGKKGRLWFQKLPQWGRTLLVVLAVVLVLCITFSVISILFPFILAGVLIWAIVQTVRKWSS